MRLSDVQTSEVAILSRVLKPEQPSLSTAAAKAILALESDAADKERMRVLSAKAQEETLTRREQAELNNFERAGHLIGLMQSKARRSIQARRATNGKGKAQRAFVDLVWQRADHRCEYCHVRQAHDPLPFEIDHIRAKKHRGRTVPGNLCLACLACNNHKGPNISGIDPMTGPVGPLFNPRCHKWHVHVRWEGPELVGLTPIGRATVEVLEINLA